MDGIISFIQMLVVVPYSIFCWQCLCIVYGNVWFVNDLIRLLLENNLNINVSENMSFVILFFSIFFGALLLSSRFTLSSC